MMRSRTAIAACVLPGSAAVAFNSTCEGMLKTLKSAVPVLPLGANPAFASALGRVVAKLNTARSRAGRQLASAKNPKAQAAAARSLAGAYQQAASGVAHLQPGPIGAEGSAAIVSALRELGAGYRRLSSAAAHNNKRAYAAARAQIAQAQTALTAGFGKLQQAGYSIG